MKDFLFRRKALEQYNGWTENKRVFKKLQSLIQDIQRNPYEGIGRPEPLKHNLSGYWSREITEGDRIIYRVADDVLEILSCKGHYDD